MLLLAPLLLSLAAFASALEASFASSHLLALAKASPEQGFDLWTEHHAKEYKSEEIRQTAFQTFQANVVFIHDQMLRNPELQLALNEFADMTWDAFSSTRLGLRTDLRSPDKLTDPTPGFMYEDTDVPNSMDWVAKGAVSDVKNQGQCGSCWAFSAVGTIEGINAIKTGELVTLSEQELVDCDTEQDMGCNGGLMDYAFDFVIKNGGIDTEQDYDYWSGWGISFMCNNKKRKDRTAVTIDGYQDVPHDEASLLKAATNQPIAVGICASSVLMFYAGGVLTECCEELNHGVLLTGFDKDENGVAYYRIKNSWGGAWGEQGYFRLKVNGGGKTGLCGIAKTASYPIKSSPNHAVPEMCDMFGWAECPAKNTCSCSFSFFGLFCIWHDCCPLENGVTCDDLEHCCPEGTQCDSTQEMCVSEDGSKPSVPWSGKTKPTVAEGEKGADLSKQLI